MKTTIDAKDQKLGRLASTIAMHLMGKNKVDFAKNKVGDVEVEVLNAAKMDIDPTKLKTKIYKRYSGYPGGQKEIKMSRMIEKHGYEGIIKNAVKGMLPPNRLRSKRLLNLTVKE
jgi:large subunit ribosomal protein L13